ncbi:PEP-CTERM sorting domain-containing protein [Nitrosomonas sp.]|uniref:PEP-CTERM sorting domain-containing protein n=1 Tax=Nitrosomonas sp. TaxID=42353 RepID=UPI00271EB43B|nr:PEP-CTERM sorting domain-containing protein [Nitrosomonas sp.]MDO8895349.1 PEP-CTERM sorting domain-containing protein [Nitrosomonas sp.]
MTRILVVTLLLISSHASALSTQWISLGAATRQGNPIEINGNSVIEFRNAGRGGIDWNVSGIGPRGGLGERELWLFDNSAAGIPGTSEATTVFSVISNSVGFIMAGDHNDGFAQFFVDNIDVGTYDMYRTGNRILVVTELDSVAHSLRIVQLGRHNPNSTKGDVAIFGGAAFNTPAIPEPEAYAMLLAGLGLIGFVARYRKKNA